MNMQLAMPNKLVSGYGTSCSHVQQESAGGLHHTCVCYKDLLAHVIATDSPHAPVK